MQLKPVIHFISPERYPKAPPFHPPEAFPELDFLGTSTDPDNSVYRGVREVLRGLGYDASRFGSADWSPLSDLVTEGGRVVLKPNFVRHFNEDPEGELQSVVTHPAVLRPLIDYALKAVGPDGTVIVADAPQYDCEVEKLLDQIRLPELLEWYASALDRRVEFRDLRVSFGRHRNGVVIERRQLAGDPEGYEAVDLGEASEFAALPAPSLRRLRGADYDEQVTIEHHSHGSNRYLVSRTILTADLVINCPKIKTHKKSGVTLSMKNLIGINGDKNWLPHYSAGFPERGGDEFPRPDLYSRFRRVGGDLARQLLKRGIGGPVFRSIRAVENATGFGARTRNGDWHGNDTIWRTCLDLNKIFYQGDRLGCLPQSGARSEESRRRTLNIYDGVISGEGRGPMGPSSRPVGLLAGGEDPGAADAVLSWILGFDWRRIPVVAHSLGELAGGVRISGFDGDASALPVLWIDDNGERETRLSEIDLNLRFDAHPGWAGHIERDLRGSSACAS